MKDKNWSLLTLSFRNWVRGLYKSARDNYKEYEASGRYNESSGQWMITKTLENLFTEKNITSNMEQEFKIGDRVRIKKNAKDYHQGYQNGYAWLPTRDKYVGKIYTIVNILEDGTIELDIPEKFTYWSMIDLEKEEGEGERTLDLCKILKGHEGKIFYNPFYGNVFLTFVNESSLGFKSTIDYNSIFATDYKGFLKFNDVVTNQECVVFPSMENRDWIKWDIKNNLKNPKTWNQFNKQLKGTFHLVELRGYGDKFTKSVMALNKILYLIEVGYDGIPDIKQENKYSIDYSIVDKRFTVYIFQVNVKNPILFKTAELAKEFLSYPENIQLLKDYFMV